MKKNYAFFLKNRTEVRGGNSAGTEAVHIDVDHGHYRQ